MVQGLDGREGNAMTGMPRMVFCDLDSTLLDSEKHMSDRTRRALRGLAGYGIGFVPSTGRSVAGIPREVIELSGARYAITADGATVCRLARDGHMDLRVSEIPRDAVIDLLNLVGPSPSYIDLFSGGEAYVERGEMCKLDNFGLLPGDVSYIRSVRHETDITLVDFVEEGRPVERLTVFYADEAMRDAVYGYSQERGDLACFTSQRTNIEITAAEASKGNALLWLCGHLGISAEESIAFGDSLNDVSMLRAAGLGVAMANADEGVRRQADDVTHLSNDESGVAEYLEGFLPA